MSRMLSSRQKLKVSTAKETQPQTCMEIQTLSRSFANHIPKLARLIFGSTPIRKRSNFFTSFATSAVFFQGFARIVSQPPCFFVCSTSQKSVDLLSYPDPS